MKTLDQVEARIPIDSVPYSIDDPGSYYLTTNLTTPANTAAITVTVSNVSIDLNGFSLTGQNSGDTGIQVQDKQQNISVRNGSISGFGNAGITGQISSSRFEKLLVSNNGGSGIIVTDDCEVRDCVVTHMGDGGFAVGIVANNGCLIVHCVANFDSGGGIFVRDHNTIESCTVAFSGGEAGIHVQSGCTVRNCTVRGNTFDGIFCGGGNQIIGNTCDVNQHFGIETMANASRIDSNTITNNGVAGMSITGNVNLIVRNSARGNGNGGAFSIAAGNVFGQVVDMSTPGQIPNTAGPWSNIAY